MDIKEIVKIICTVQILQKQSKRLETVSYTHLHYEKENDDFYISLYYPKLKEKNLNKIIKESYSTYLKSEKKKKDQKDILYLDYSCKKIYKQYVVVELDYKRINEDETKTKATKSIMTYDCKTNQLVALKDCLHGKYGDLLNTLGVNEYNKESTLIKVDKDSFTYYTDDTLKNKIVVNYKEYKDYIKLANKNIPSNAPLDVKAPKLMKVDPKKKMVAITLDDGPHKTLTERAMNAFEKYNGRGTFFELGKNINLYPNIVKSVYERGHEIACLLYTQMCIRDRIRAVEGNEDLLIITDDGIVIRLPMEQVKTAGRATQGVRLIKVHDSKVSSVEVVAKNEEEVVEEGEEESE